MYSTGCLFEQGGSIIMVEVGLTVKINKIKKSGENNSRRR